MFDAKKFIERVRAVNPGKSVIHGREIDAIREANRNDLARGIIDAFNLGFLKGQRAEHKKHVKPRLKFTCQRDVHRRNLEHYINKHAEDDEYIKMLYARARILDDVLGEKREKESARA